MTNDRVGTHDEQHELFTAADESAYPCPEGYTKGLWATSIAPPKDLHAGLPAINTVLTSYKGGIIATFEVGNYAPGDRYESAANARRAAACVNALEGVSTKDIERLPMGLLAEFIRAHAKPKPTADDEDKAAQTLRTLLDERSRHTEGTLQELASRCLDLSRGDKNVIDFLRKTGGTPQPQERV